VELDVEGERTGTDECDQSSPHLDNHLCHGKQPMSWCGTVQKKKKIWMEYDEKKNYIAKYQQRTKKAL